MERTGQLTVYRACIPVVETRYSRCDAQTVMETVVGALEEADAGASIDLQPLYNSIDPDLLAWLVERHDRPGRSAPVVSFQHRNWSVYVRGDGRIQVCDANRRVNPEPVFRNGKHQRRSSS